MACRATARRASTMSSGIFTSSPDSFTTREYWANTSKAGPIADTK